MADLDCHDDNITVEWVNGVKYMSPSPHPNHAMVYSELFNTFYNYLKGKTCRVFPDKVDLYISNPKEPINITDLKRPVVPDLFIVCDNNFELVNNNIVAVPDFICEIVSPSSVKMDNNIKKDLYLSKGVKEYWVVNYLDKSIKVYFNGKEDIFTFDDNIKVNVLNDLTICLKDVSLFKV